MSSRCRYLSGTLTTSGERRDLIVDDGRFTHGFIVSDFFLWPARGSQLGDMSCVVATKSNGAATPMLAEDSRQVAWGYCGVSPTPQGIVTHYRPEEVILEELMILADFAGAFTDGLNYLIKLEPVIITDSQAALVLINNKAQDLS